MGSAWSYIQSFGSEPFDLRLAKFKQYSRNARDVFDVLRLEEDAQRDFFDFFELMDTDQSGEIDYWEFLDRLCLKDTKLMERVFLAFDKDGGGGIDFREFVVQVWNIVTRTETMLIQLMFDIFDDDHNNYLSPAECIALLKMINGADAEGLGPQELQDLMKRIDSNHDGQISFEELVAFCKGNSLFILPIRNLQRRLQHSICSPEYWHTLRDWRVLQFGPRADILQILQEHSILSTKVKKMKEEDQAARVEEKKQQMILAQAERAKTLNDKCRKMTEREMILLVIYAARRHLLIKRSLNESMSDVEQQHNRYQRGQLTANIQELYGDMDTVFELEFKKVETESIASSEQSTEDFLNSPIGTNVVQSAAEHLIAKASEDSVTAGRRLTKVDAEDLVRSKLQDTLMSQAQHQLVSDYERMKEVQNKERKQILQRINTYDQSVLQHLANGDSSVLAAALGWSKSAVESSKGLWYEMEFGDKPETKEEELRKDTQILRAKGFSSMQAQRFHKEVERAVSRVLCPAC